MTIPLPVLGVDGGGTHTRAVVVQADGTIAGYGEAAGCNYHNSGARSAADRIGEACEAAMVQAGFPAHTAASAVFVGTAGIKADVDVHALQTELVARRLAANGQIRVANDSENAHAGGLAGRAGVALICGTGSIALGRDAEGHSALCGGWGWLLDDAGSGSWLGVQALRHVVRAVDGRAPATTLSERLLGALQITDPHTLLARVYVGGIGVAEFAALAPIVTQAAAEGDTVATSLLEDGARELARLVRGAAHGVRLDAAPCAVVLIGGLARSGPPYQPMIEAAITAALPAAIITAPELPPVVGAAIRALELAGYTSDAAVLARLKSTSTRLLPHA